MINEKLGYPCRNFCIFSSDTFIDPKDSRRKFVVSSFVASGKGVAVIIDVKSGEGETIGFPADEGAWATLCWNNERLLFGTCAKYGYLHCFDLKDRTWLPSLKDKDELYFWNLVKGSDDRIYGGTWPGGVLLRYDPRLHILENMGRMSPYEGNNYTRPLYNGVSGKIFLTSGYDKTHMVSYDIETEKYVKFGDDFYMIKEANEDFICGINENLRKIAFYDPRTLSKLTEDMPYDKLDLAVVDNEAILDYLKNFSPAGRHKGPNVYVPDWSGCDYVIKPAGQSYSINYNDGKTITRPIPTQAPPTAILTVAYDGKGKIWGSSGLGQTIFSYDIETGEYINTLEVCFAGGEVYGICPVKDRIYMTSYCGGEHIVYYPDKPFNLGDNPKIIETLRPSYIRPHTRSSIGADGNIWTGWWADYGTYGGAISKIDVNTDEVTVYPGIIPDQCPGHLVCSKSKIIYTTTGHGNGLPARKIPLWLCAVDYDGKEVYKKEFTGASVIGPMLYAKDKLYIRVDDEILILNEYDFSQIGKLVLPKGENDGSPYTCLMNYDENTFVAFHYNTAYFIDVRTNFITEKAETEGPVYSACRTDSGDIYYPVRAALFKLTFE